MDKKKTGKIIATFNFEGKEVIIRADIHQYVLTIGSRSTYYGYISDCFEELFEWLVRERLLGEEGKGIEEIVEIMVDTKREILKIIEPFESLFVL